MRENRRVEREYAGSRRGRSRAPSPKRYGYIHRVDKESISFFVTYFPEDCTVEDLWKLFARHGHVGDVYIPNKVDKWGKRFAFVKFRDVKEVGELSQRLEDVWFGSFKLRVNRSRFDRNEEGRKKEAPVRSLPLVGGVGDKQQSGSFKTTLLFSSGRDEVSEKVPVEQREVLNVEVDGTLLKELEQSYVGKLAFPVEVKRIKTTLYMEGLAHISVTNMGGEMVLIYSPKRGEVEVMCKSKPEWLTHYFKEVRQWSPSCFMDSRIAWVKIYGIPLHVWGENLFKAIGKSYEEFLDFDENTTSRAKLDVARIKISTNFRGCIDDPVCVKAMGVIYNIRIVEERGLEQVFSYGERMNEHDAYWGESSIYPAEAVEVDGGVVVGSVGVEGEEEEVDFHMCQKFVHGEEILDDGDVLMQKSDFEFFWSQAGELVAKTACASIHSLFL